MNRAQSCLTTCVYRADTGLWGSSQWVLDHMVPLDPVLKDPPQTWTWTLLVLKRMWGLQGFMDRFRLLHVFIGGVNTWLVIRDSASLSTLKESLRTDPTLRFWQFQMLKTSWGDEGLLSCDFSSSAFKCTAVNKSLFYQNVFFCALFPKQNVYCFCLVVRKRNIWLIPVELCHESHIFLLFFSSL